MICIKHVKCKTNIIETPITTLCCMQRLLPKYNINVHISYIYIVNRLSQNNGIEFWYLWLCVIFLQICNDSCPGKSFYEAYGKHNTLPPFFCYNENICIQFQYVHPKIYPLCDHILSCVDKGQDIVNYCSQFDRA